MRVINTYHKNFLRIADMSK